MSPHQTLHAAQRDNPVITIKTMRHIRTFRCIPTALSIPGFNNLHWVALDQGRMAAARGRVTSYDYYRQWRNQQWRTNRPPR
jgi:hypothetical protein